MRELIASYNKKDFDVQTFCSGGPGGQHQNKTESGVRIVHLPTKLSAECRESRSQHQNKRIAFRKLAEKIRLWHVAQLQQDRIVTAEAVRTYNEPDNRIKDHLSGFKQLYSEGIDDISLLVAARANAMKGDE